MRSSGEWEYTCRATEARGGQHWGGAGASPPRTQYTGVQREGCERGPVEGVQWGNDLTGLDLYRTEVLGT